MLSINADAVRLMRVEVSSLILSTPAVSGIAAVSAGRLAARIASSELKSMNQPPYGSARSANSGHTILHCALDQRCCSLRHNRRI